MISIYTGCLPSFRPEIATTRGLPIPADTCFGAACACAFITVSANRLSGQNHAMTGAVNTGLARHTKGAVLVIGRVSP
jgi:hypothetical protein